MKLLRTLPLLLIALIAAQPALAAYAHVQSGTNTGSGVTTAQTIVPGAGFTAGNTVFGVVLYFQNGGDPARTIVSVTDQSSNALTYSQPATQRYATDTGMLVFVIQNIPSGVTSLIVTISGTPAFGSNRGYSEYSGLVTSGTDGANSISASAGTGTDAVLSGTASNASQPALCWGVASDSVFNSVPAAGTGFTSRVSANALQIEDKQLTATGSQQATFTNTHGSAANHIAYMIIIDDASVGEPSIPAIYQNLRQQKL